MKVFKSIIVCALGIAGLISCKDKEKQVTPVDESAIMPSGTVEEIIVPNNVFIDTGMTITVKGKGFDSKYKDQYFLLFEYGSRQPIGQDSTLSRSFSDNISIRDKNMVSFSDSVMVFKYPRHYLYNTNDHTLDIYFTKVRKKDISEGLHGTDINAKIAYKKLVPNLPVYKLLKDTLVLDKVRNGRNKEIIIGSYRWELIKVMIQNLEYPSKDGYFFTNVDYNEIHEYKRITLSMVATQDLFYLPDGWYDFEIFERGGTQRKFVEETGKTKVYIKNVP